MNKTYGEARQEAYFAAARKLYRLAGQVLDDTCDETSLSNEATVQWAVSVANATEKQARELESTGHEQTRATPIQEHHLSKARHDLYRSRDEFSKRLRAVQEVVTA